MKNLFLKNLLLFLLFSIQAFSQDGNFNFTISSSVNTSAGVFKSNGTLVRTLWNNVRYAPGTYTRSWDGKDDLGVTIASPDASYQIKILTNNVNYTWQGTVGNSSTAMTGAAKHRGLYHCMRGLIFVGSTGYFCTGYGEGASSLGKFNTSTPNTKIDFPGITGATGDINYVATDGVNVYWAAFDAYQGQNGNTWVVATKVSDDSEVPFANGSSYSVTYGKTWKYTIARLNQDYSTISGLAVQKNGSYLFVARAGINQVQVLNKTTGALVQTLNITSPESLCMDASDNLWMVSGTGNLSKYTVNQNGTLSNATLSLSGLVDPLAVQVSNDGSQVTVADGGSSQQVKFFDNATGNLTAVLGTVGGYSLDAAVNNSKFYFSDINGSGINQYNKLPFVAYQTDGSFWVNDPGNFRVQHYNSGKSFVDRIMSLGASYSVFADKKNINKVFSDYLEFEIDYNVQTLSGNSGWQLKKNWGALLPTSIYNGPPRFETTLSNGRTYGFIRNVHQWEVVEFPSSGTLRLTGIKLGALTQVLCDDGSLQDFNTKGTTATLQRYPLVGFDAAGNPKWDTKAELLGKATMDIVNGNPVAFPNGQVFTGSTDKIAYFNYKAYANDIGPIFSTGTHLGVMKKGETDNYLFQTEKSTHRNYEGGFPEPGWFDEGNLVNDYAGGNVNIVDRNIITSYHGEFWKNSQTNKFNHYYDNGLAVGQFGITGPEMNGPASAMMAGNALTPVVVKDANGDLYLWHGDESHHAAIHRWKISGLNTINEQTVSIPFPSAFAAANLNYVNLMTGLPFDATLQDNTAGWTRNPTSNYDSNPWVTLWRVRTSKMSYEKLTSNDILIEFVNQTAITNTVSRDLGTNNVTKDWKVAGEIAYPEDNNVNGLVTQQFVEVLDANGKILTAFYLETVGGKTTIYGNKTGIFSSTGMVIQKAVVKMTPFEMGVTNGVASFTYGNYAPVTSALSDASGNWRTPKTLRIRFVNNGLSGQPYKEVVGIKDLKFYKDLAAVAAPIPNKAPTALAGPDQSITLPTSSVNLTGSGNDSDGTISSYAWVKIAGPASGTIAAVTTAATAVNTLVQGTYQFELTVTDNSGATGKDTVQVIVNPAASNLLAAVNPANTVNGLDYKYYEGSWTVLPAFASLTPVKTGTTNNFDITPANRSDLYGFNFTGYINVPADGQYTFYTSSDDGSSLYIDNVLVVANDGLHGAEEKSGSIGLKAGKHAIAGLFFQQGGGQVFTVSYAATGIAKQAIPAAALYRVTTAVANKAPVANAGADQTVTLPATPTLSGNGTDTDGTIASYSWTKISGPSSGALSALNLASTTLINLVQGIYQFELTVTDNSGAVGKDTLQVTVNAAAVIGNLLSALNLGTTASGLDYKYYEGSWTTLPAFNTLTPVKTGTTPTFNIGLANRSDLYGFSFTGYINIPADGQYTFYTTSDDGSSLYIDNVLTVANDGLHGSEEKSGEIGLKAGLHAITGLFFQQGGGQVFTVSYASSGISKQVIPASALYRLSTGNKAPVANAGADQIITLPLAVVTLIGSGNDSDGTIANYTWSQLSGPASGLLGSAGLPTTLVSSLLQGVYQYVLTVTDNNGATGKDTVQITVNPLSGALNLLAALNPSGTVNGLDYKYYEGNWSVLPPFANLTPIKTGNTTYFTLSLANRSIQYAFSFTGYINVPTDGKYNFYTTSDDGSALYIDNTLIVSNDGLHGATEKSGSVGLKAGKHAINAVFFQQSGDQVFSVSYDGPGITKQVIPAKSLFRPGTANMAPQTKTAPAQLISGSPVNTPEIESVENKVRVYPNPVTDIANLNISTIAGNKKVSIAVYNSTGLLVRYKELTGTQVNALHKMDMTGLSTGIYAITVRFDNGRQITYRVTKGK